MEVASGAPDGAVNTASLFIDSPTPDALSVSGGTIIVQALSVAHSAGSSATQTLGDTGNIDITTTGTLRVGTAAGANGTLTLGSLGTLTAANVNVAQDGTATGTLNIDGAFTSSSRVYVAGDSTDDSDAGTTGTINVSSTGTFTVVAGNTEIGRDGQGTLNVDGGTYNQNAGNLVLGQNGGANPDTSVGTVTFSNGATVNIGDTTGEASNININDGGGDITQTGATTAVTVFQDLNFSPSENGSSYLLAGGTLDVDRDINSRGGSGQDTLTITGGALDAIGNLNFSAGTNNLVKLISDTSTVTVGGLVFGAGTTVEYEFNSLGSVSSLGVQGNVTLNDATLVLSGTLPTAGSTTLIDGDASVYTGTFAGLPEGAFFEQGGQNYEITYAGGDGFDTVITAVAGPIVTISADSGSVVEGGTAGFTLTRVGPTAGDIDVTLAYSGSATDGSDFTGVAMVTIPNLATSADLDLSTSPDGDYEGCEVINAVITGVSSSVMAEVGSPAEAAIALLDANVTPTVNENFEQTLAGSGTVPIDAIVVSDPDADYDSNYDTTTSTPLYHYTGQSNVSVFNDGRANEDFDFDLDATGPTLDEGAGFSLDFEFTPSAGDVAGTTLVWEIGGSSNGSSFYLLDGIPHLLVKCNGVAADVPTDDGTTPGVFTDLDWDNPEGASGPTDDTVVVPLGTTALAAGLPARIAVIFDILGDTVTWSVNGAAADSATLVGRDGTNWRGDHSVAHGQRSGGIGGANNVSGAPFEDTGTRKIKDFENGFGAFGCVRFWNESSGSIGNIAGGPEDISVLLDIQGWSTTTDGSFTSSGPLPVVDLTGGDFSIVGPIDDVNATLAGLEFVESTASFPVTINVEVSDGGVILFGFIVINDVAPATVYVDDDFAGAAGSAIADADGGSAVSPATFQADAFTNFADALAVVAAGGTIVVNDGAYPEQVGLSGTISLRVTDSAGPVTIDSLAGEAGNGIQIDAPNTLVLGDDAGNNVIAGTISGGGNLTKQGTDVLILTGVNSYGGQTSVDEGILRVGDNTITGVIGGSGNIVVAAGATYQLRPAVDTTTTVNGTISGDGAVHSQGDGTVNFIALGPNTFTGGFELGDGAVSVFDGVDQGAKQGFVVVNNSGHLGTGLIRSRGGQLQAGSAGINIANDIDIDGGGLRMGGTTSFELSGKVAPIGGTRGITNAGLEGTVITISNELDLYQESVATGRGVNFEASNDRDNGDIIVSGDISGTGGNIQVTSSFDNGLVVLGGTNTYTGTTIVGANLVDGVAVLNGTHTGGGTYSVNSGTLAGAGSTDSTVNVNPNGTITGAGSLTSAGILGTGDLTILGTLLVGIEDSSMPAGAGGYGQINVTGSVDVSTATLAFLTDGSSNLADATITIIANDAADAVSPAFTGLPEGASIPIDLVAGATVSYIGDTGNDITLAVAAALDSDMDGIPDGYELANGLNRNDPSDAATDPDGDGTSALQEWLFGTLENNAGSVFTVNLTSVDVCGAGTLDVTYGPVFAGLTYQVTKSTDAMTFNPVGGAFAPGADAPANSETDSAATDDVGLYRVTVSGNELP
ncbi:MAG: hypothetical protein HKO57_02830 [Akkermansiaceae bacterium]|nr:hypothetical protein [Akkermansiaceae bacterium]